jgi:hypothetical protein
MRDREGVVDGLTRRAGGDDHEIAALVAQQMTPNPSAR